MLAMTPLHSGIKSNCALCIALLWLHLQCHHQRSPWRNKENHTVAYGWWGEQQRSEEWQMFGEIKCLLLTVVISLRHKLKMTTVCHKSMVSVSGLLLWQQICVLFWWGGEGGGAFISQKNGLNLLLAVVSNDTRSSNLVFSGNSF